LVGSFFFSFLSRGLRIVYPHGQVAVCIGADDVFLYDKPLLSMDVVGYLAVPTSHRVADWMTLLIWRQQESAGTFIGLLFFVNKDRIE
jgi:hypothetical protein